MRGSTLTLREELTFHIEECCNCGVLFAVTEQFYEQCLSLKTRKSFFCPNGHSQYYLGKSDAELRRLAEQRARAAELAAQAERDQRLAAERELKRHRRRTAGGVCPCCNRSFVQLARHMKTKHPDFTP